MAGGSGGHNLDENLKEKRAKREIANMNERRRMQNINAGFHSLRSLLPQKHNGEKLSKAAILQHTANYIYQLENEISKLLPKHDGGSSSKTEWLKRLQSQPPDCPSCKRKKFENSHRLDLDSSPMGGDGSSTESSSEQEITTSSKSNQRNKNRQSSVSMRQSDTATTLRKQLIKIEKELEEERRLRYALEDELHRKDGHHSSAIHSSNGRNFYSNSVEQDAEEVEVASESLEIEMHSCPASPPEMLIATSDHQTNLYHLEQAQLLEPQQRLQKQNAIALPIDVPFVTTHEIDPNADSTGTDQLKNAANQVLFLVDSDVMVLEHATKLHPSTCASSSTISDSDQTHILQLIPNNSSAKDGGPTILTAKHIKTESGDQAKTSRQNLNTIVEAIRHLEGDSLFNETVVVGQDENGVTTTNCVLKSSTNGTSGNGPMITKKMIIGPNNSIKTSNKSNSIANAKIIAVTNQGGQNSIRTYPITTTTIQPNKQIQTIKIKTEEGSPENKEKSSSTTTSSATARPQIIQIQRPNVIVANSIEN
ncbi:Transcription factor AP-4 [Sarcoptes scabiei]|uniref:Transcription factor AP-4 n=1 Tax=Sarcoptes scabiei TaxID=52283 RepID=A0A131ZU41_SARSC|nr:Transcription factor AP-4 [Sarcoptes scabiei]KPM02277.1 transcription factor AP-4-like protein [Sarcoptes scabiei]